MSQIVINDPNAVGGSSALNLAADGWVVGPYNASILAKWAAAINANFAELYRQVGNQSASAASTPFSTTVPLNSFVRMPDQSVAGAVLAFTPAASPVANGSCTFRLTADGTHAPTFAGFTAANGSAGWSNTAGAVNLINFNYDGTTSWYSIFQTVPTSAPAVTGLGVVHGSNPTITLTIGGTGLNAAIVPPASAFALSTTQGATINPNQVSVTADSITLGLVGTVNLGDTVTLSYTPPVLSADVLAPGAKPGAAQDASGTYLAAFASASVAVS